MRKKQRNRLLPKGLVGGRSMESGSPTTSALTCAECQAEKPLVKYLNDDGEWVWLGLECAAAKGNPTALHLKTTAWIDSLLVPVMPVEGVM